MFITRAEYLSNTDFLNEEESFKTHRAYLSQFVTPDTITYVATKVGHNRLMSSTDRYLNDIPLHIWDRLTTVLPFNYDALREAGETASLGTLVCVAKEAARQYIESQA